MEKRRKSTRKAERRFFTTFAIVMLLLVFVGFAPTYYLRPIAAPDRPIAPLYPLLHLHALVYSAWIILFAVQSSLIAANRTALHRRLGMLGGVLVTLMIPLGLSAAIIGISRPLTAPPGIDPLSWAALSIFDVPVFAGMIIWALVKRHDLVVHKRLMLIATINMLGPAIGRALPPGFLGEFTGLATLLFLVPLFIWDYYSRGKIHSVTIWASAIVVARIFLTPLIWSTPQWMAIATSLSKLN